jgi:hypothetical protein
MANKTTFGSTRGEDATTWVDEINGISLAPLDLGAPPKV